MIFSLLSILSSLLLSYHFLYIMECKIENISYYVLQRRTIQTCLLSMFQIVKNVLGISHYVYIGIKRRIIFGSLVVMKVLTQILSIHQYKYTYDLQTSIGNSKHQCNTVLIAMNIVVPVIADLQLSCKLNLYYVV